MMKKIHNINKTIKGGERKDIKKKKQEQIPKKRLGSKTETEIWKH